MIHFGIICPPATGHLNTILPLGQELQKRGHRVTLFGILDTKAKTVAAGIEFCVLGESEFPLGSVDKKNDLIGELSGKEARQYALNWREKLVPVLLEEGKDAIAQAGVTALLVDHKSKEGGTVAEALQIPFVTVCSALVSERYGSLKSQNPLHEKINDYRQRWQLPAYSTDRQCYSPLAQISHQPPSFDRLRTTRTALPKCFHFTGPYHNQAGRLPVDFPWSRLNGKPLIYASMGTIQNRRQSIFQEIATACAEFDVQLVISLGGGLEAEAVLPLPGEPIVVSYAPQLELLEKAALTITNAGLNTTLECLRNGVPIIAIPVSYEQPAIASRIESKGVGVAIGIEQLTASRLTQAITTVLGKDSYRDHAIKLGKTIINSGGVKLAADIVEQAITTKEPVINLDKCPHKPQNSSVKPTNPDHKYLNLLETVEFEPIFILGAHRSGTTLLYQTLTDTQCFNFISAYHVIEYETILANFVEGKEQQEYQQLTEKFQELGISDRVIDNINATPVLPEEYGFILKNADYDFHVNKANIRYFKKLCQKLQYISDSQRKLLLKNPWDFDNFLYIKKALPQAKFIFIHRHPIHVINSKLKAVKTLFDEYSPYSALISKRYVRSFSNVVQRSLRLDEKFAEQRIHTMTAQAQKYTTYFLQRVQELPEQDYLSIKYEDVCQAPRNNITNILNFLGLEAKVDLDYENLIAPRPLNLLPEVENNQEQMRQQLQPYFKYHGYE